MPTSRPLSVYPANTPIEGLRTAELFAICAARLWVAQHKDPNSMAPDWRDGFEFAGLSALGVASFDAQFTIIAAAAHRSLDFRCRRCPTLGDDEGLMLHGLSLFQADRLREASRLLADWLPPAAVRQAMAPGKAYADALADIGLQMPRRHGQAGQAQPHTARGSVDHGLSLLQ